MNMIIDYTTEESIFKFDGPYRNVTSSNFVNETFSLEKYTITPEELSKTIIVDNTETK